MNKLPAGLFERKRDIESAQPLAALRFRHDGRDPVRLDRSRAMRQGPFPPPACRNIRSRFAPP